MPDDPLYQSDRERVIGSRTTRLTLTSWAVSCLGKKAHSSRSAALQELAKVRKKYPASYSNDRGVMTAYLCQHCGLWHLGHRKGSEP
jgi:hypothetical protein